MPGVGTVEDGEGRQHGGGGLDLDGDAGVGQLGEDLLQPRHGFLAGDLGSFDLDGGQRAEQALTVGGAVQRAVVMDHHDAVGAGPACHVNPNDGHGLRRAQIDTLAGLLALGQHILGDAAIAAIENPSRQIIHPFDPHAAVREKAIVAREGMFRRRVMHVDRMGIGHVDADRAQGVVRA